MNVSICPPEMNATLIIDKYSIHDSVQCLWLLFQDSFSKIQSDIRLYQDDNTQFIAYISIVALQIVLLLSHY